MRAGLFCISLLLSLLLIPGCATPTRSSSGATEIYNVTIVDVRTGQLVEGKTIRLVGNRIQAVTDTPSLDVAARFDGSGKFVIPGLWDMHGHLEMFGFDPAVPLLVAHGVTGVRDMGSDFASIQEMRAAIAANRLPHLRTVVAGQMVDGATPNWPFRITVTTPEQGRAAVRQQAALGVDFIKVHAQLDKATYLAIAEEAQRLSIPFAGHVPNKVTAQEAAVAGQKSTEHLTGVPWCKLPQCPEALGSVTALRDRGVHAVPTLSVYDAEVRSEQGKRLTEAEWRLLPPVAHVWWQFQDSVNEPYRSAPSKRLAEAQESLAKTLQLSLVMYQSGVPIMAGTDFGYAGVIPGAGLHRELALLVQAGLTPLQALQAATIVPAMYLRQPEIGQVAPGAYADLLLLERNPLLDISATGQIFAVVANGRIFDRSELDQLLNPVNRPRTRAARGRR